MPLVLATPGMLGTSGTAVNPNSVVVNPTAGQIAAAITQNAGTVNLSNGINYQVYAIPTSLTYTVTSNNGGGAAATIVYAFNNSDLNALVTTNGSGAVSIVNTFGDGFSGKVYNQYFRTANNGAGINIVGFTIQATNFTSGAQTPSAYSGLGLTFLFQNGYGQTIPVTVDMNQALRNTAQISGMLTLGFKVTLSALTQLTLTLPVNTSMTFTFFTDASGFTNTGN